MGVGARSGFGSHCALPSSTLSSIQAASAFGCLAKFVTLRWVWLLWCLSKEALGGCGSDLSGFCQCLLSGVYFHQACGVPSHPLLHLPADTGCCGHGEWCCQGSRLQPVWVPLTHLLPGAQPDSAWCCRKLECWEGSVTCRWRLHWPFPGGQQLCPGSSFYCQVSAVPKRLVCEWDSVPWVVLSNGLAWCPQMYMMLASSLVVSIGLLFQERLVSRIAALIDLADDMGRRNKGIKPLSDLPGVRAEACSRTGCSVCNAWCALAVTLPVE